MNSLIPPYLDDGEPVFIRLAKNSKAPKKGNSAKEGPFFRLTDEKIQKHIQNGGNVGRVFRDEIIAIDVDHQILLNQLEKWPDTLVIESGGDGIGSHWYYRVPGYGENQTELTTDGINIGSIRSGNSYCLVPPSRHDETGDKYVVSNPQNPSEISVSRLSDLIEEFGNANTGGGGAAAGVGSDASIPKEYPNKSVDWETAKKWLKSNGFLSDLDRTTCSDWSGLEFKIAKCLAEGGFSETVISDVLDRLSQNSKWHSREQNYRDLTIQKAIESAVADPYVSFDTGDMRANNAFESRKTESSEKDTGLPGGEKIMSESEAEYNEKEAVQLLEATDEGDSFKKLALMERKENGDSVEYLAIKEGYVRKVETVDGQTVLAQNVQKSRSLGYSPENINDLIDGLEDMAEKLE